MIEMKNEFKKTISKIEKKYKDKTFDYKPSNISAILGKKINVYVDTIGQSIEEYLVNFEFFIDIMKEYGFELSSLERTHKPTKGYDIFRNKNTSYMDGLGGFEQIIEELPNIIQKEPTFYEHYSEAPLINTEKYNQLKLLSSFHNWFIFKKV
jgi:hypothetical protein